MPPAVPPEGGAVEGEREEEEGKYSHYGEFQALIKKWINREVSDYQIGPFHFHFHFSPC